MFGLATSLRPERSQSPIKPQTSRSRTASAQIEGNRKRRAPRPEGRGADLWTRRRIATRETPTVRKLSKAEGYFASFFQIPFKGMVSGSKHPATQAAVVAASAALQRFRV